MDEAREGELGRTHAAAGGVLGLEHDDRAAGPGEGDGGGEAVRAGPDDDGVDGLTHECVGRWVPRNAT